jgi:hypothetical protein
MRSGPRQTRFLWLIPGSKAWRAAQIAALHTNREMKSLSTGLAHFEKPCQFVPSESSVSTPRRVFVKTMSLKSDGPVEEDESRGFLADTDQVHLRLAAQ